MGALKCEIWPVTRLSETKTDEGENMLTKVKMPRLGENVNSVFIVEIMVEPGQQIAAGDVLASVETDKATVEVQSPVAGTVVEILVKMDEEVAPGSPYIVLETA